MSGPAEPADAPTRSTKPYIIALTAVAVWAALRLVPGDITPVAPETILRHAGRATPSPRRLYQQPQPFPSYDPTVAFSLVDHVSEAQVTHRQRSDSEALRAEIKRLRARLSRRWLSASGDWRVAGEGVLTCLVEYLRQVRDEGALADCRYGGWFGHIYTMPLNTSYKYFLSKSSNCSQSAR